MRTFATSLLILVVGLVGLSAQQRDPNLPRAVPGRLIVKIAATVNDPIVVATGLLAPVGQRFGITRVATWLQPGLLLNRNNSTPLPKSTSLNAPRSSSLARILVVEFDRDLDPGLVARKIAQMPGVEYAEPQWERYPLHIPNDELIPQQWYLDRINAFGGWDIERGDTSIVVGIVDTGIDPTHPDLLGTLWQNQGEMGFDDRGIDRRSNGIDDDGNGIIDDWQGYDFGGDDGITPDNDPSPHYYHGTHVAGVVGASGNNSIGIAGVAFGVRLMSVKVSDEDANEPVIINGYDGLLYAARMGCRVINCSWGGRGYSAAEQEVLDSVRRLGALVIASAGNNGDATEIFPGSYIGVLSVAALNSDDSRSDFSNYGLRVGIAAPGRGVISTVPARNGSPAYRIENGTSVSAPIVSGVAALVALQRPEYRPDQIAARLRATAEAFPTDLESDAPYLGSGRIDARRALADDTILKWAEINQWSVASEAGNSVIEPGDVATIACTLHNYFRPLDNCSLLFASPPGSRFGYDNLSVTIGPLDRDQSIVVDPSRLRIRIHDSIPPDYVYNLNVTIFDGTTKVGSGRIEFVTNPNFATTGYNRMRATFTGDGRVGYNDYPANNQGEGIRIDSSGSLMSEGGLIIGRDVDRVADVIRGETSLRQNRGLHTIHPYRTVSEAGEKRLAGLGMATDSVGNAAGLVGVDVTLQTMQSREADADQATFLYYRLHNTTNDTLRNVCLALYLDWDIGPGGTHDQITFDPNNRMGIARNTAGQAQPMAGIALLNDLPMSFNALDFTVAPLRGGFTRQEKWESVSRGILRTTSNIGDCSMTIGAGGLALLPGADTTVVFVITAGASTDELERSIGAARAIYERDGGHPGGPIMLPQRLAIGDPFPNPMRETTSIPFAVAEEGTIQIDLYSTIGERIATLVDGWYPKGEFSIELSREVLSEAPLRGVCFVRFVSHGDVVSQKIMVLPRE